VNLLLDTHALIWWLVAPEQLVEPARQAIADPTNAIYVSTASAWELAIKSGQGRLLMPPDLQGWLPARLNAERLTPIPIKLDHALSVEQLPTHHRDPFDRLLIAQALAENMTLVSRDRVFQAYPVRVLPC
jgi:PIN domain nuclease of toxin-antitoxin system